MQRRLPLLTFCSLSLGRRVFSSRDKSVSLAFASYGNPEKDRKRPPLVIVHGLFGQKQNWNSVAKALQQRLGNSVFAVDMRNHGDSPWTPSMDYNLMAADLVEFVDFVKKNCDFEHVSLLGHSMGGKAVMKASTLPNLAASLDAIIVEDVAPKPYADSHAHFPVMVAAMHAANLKSRTRQQVGEDLATAVPDPSVRQFLLTNLAPEGDGLRWKPNLDAIENSLPAILGFHLPLLSRFVGPTLFLYGEASQYVLSADRPEILRHFPNASFNAIPRAGHWVHADSPKLFIDAVVRFLTSV